jgi:hypothetical protein
MKQDILNTHAERYPKVFYMRPEGLMEYYTDQSRPEVDNAEIYCPIVECIARYGTGT